MRYINALPSTALVTRYVRWRLSRRFAYDVGPYAMLPSVIQGSIDVTNVIFISEWRHKQHAAFADCRAYSTENPVNDANCRYVEIVNRPQGVRSPAMWKILFSPPYIASGN